MRAAPASRPACRALCGCRYAWRPSYDRGAIPALRYLTSTAYVNRPCAYERGPALAHFTPRPSAPGQLEVLIMGHSFAGMIVLFRPRAVAHPGGLGAGRQNDAGIRRPCAAREPGDRGRAIPADLRSGERARVQGARDEAASGLRTRSPDSRCRRSTCTTRAPPDQRPQNPPPYCVAEPNHPPPPNPPPPKKPHWGATCLTCVGCARSRIGDAARARPSFSEALLRRLAYSSHAGSRRAPREPSSYR